MFSFFMVAACGVVGNKFFPTADRRADERQPLVERRQAVAALAPHAANLLFIKNLNFPHGGPKAAGTPQGSASR